MADGVIDLVIGSFWHLSDLHLDARPNADVPVRDIERHMLAHAARERKRQQASSSPPARALVVTGDLMREANAANARAARDFLGNLAKALELPDDRVFVVPGRRDIDVTATTLAASLAHFRAATSGFVKPDSAKGRRVLAQCLEDAALSLVLIDSLGNLATGHEAITAMYDAMQRGVPAGTVSDWTTVRAGLEAALRQHSACMGADGMHLPVLRNDSLALAVSHLPLSPLPADDGQQFFVVPAGAGRAKRELAAAGVDVCLHGHTHGHFVHTELLPRDAQGAALDLTSIGCPAMTGMEPAFHIVHYAVNRETGEARLRVMMHRLTDISDTAADERLVAIRPRTEPVARSLRATVRINDQGDSRTDVWYQGVPTWHWPMEGGRRVKDFPVVFSGHNPGQRAPAVTSLSPTALKVMYVGDRATDLPPGTIGPEHETRGIIQLSAVEDAPRVSFAYRLFSPSEYATSLGDRIRGYKVPQVFHMLAPDEEARAQVPGGSYERLEMFVRTPFPPSGAELRTFLRRPGGNGVPVIEEEPRLRELFTRATVEWWPQAKRIRAVVDRPMKDVWYALVWKIPTASLGMESYTPVQIDQAIDNAESLRSRVAAIHPLLRREAGAGDAAEDQEAWPRILRELIDPFFEHVRSVVGHTGSVDRKEEIEITLMLPNSEKLKVPEFEKRYASGYADRPQLVVIAESQRGVKRETSVRIPVGHGVAGRAYATNSGTEYISSFAGRGRSELPGIGDIYVPPMTEDGRSRLHHAVLYGLPIRHWDIQAVVLGCLCIGSRWTGSVLDLKCQDPDALLYAYQLIAQEGSRMLEALWKRATNPEQRWKPLESRQWRPVGENHDHRGYWREIGPGLTTLSMPALPEAPLSPGPANTPRRRKTSAKRPLTESLDALVTEVRKVIAKELDEIRLDLALRRIGRNLQSLLTPDARNTTFAAKVTSIVELALKQSWFPNLLASLRIELPTDPVIFVAAGRFGAEETLRAVSAKKLRTLERIVVATNPALTPDVFTAGLLDVQTRVCRIEIPSAGKTSYGTGFLVGPELVLTNYHVVERLVEGERHDRAVLRFDYKRTRDGSQLPGKMFWLESKDWVVASSPVEALDYALLRVRGAPGTMPLSGDAVPPGVTVTPRGWIDLTAEPPEVSPGSEILIMQHPLGAPIVLAMDMDSVTDVFEDTFRIRYKTNTEGGSSGSPCFNAAWQLIALHQSGDPEWNAKYNEGILIGAIQEDIAKQARAKGTDLEALGIRPFR